MLTDKALFVPMLIITDIYKTMGWGTIIYFAALSGVDPQLYEAAEIDGARKWKQMINITLPAITPTIVIMLILNCNNIVNAGFDQIFMLYSALVYDVADIIDPYRYPEGRLLLLYRSGHVQIRHRSRHDPHRQLCCQEDRQRGYLVRRL